MKMNFERGKAFRWVSTLLICALALPRASTQGSNGEGSDSASLPAGMPNPVFKIPNLHQTPESLNYPTPHYTRLSQIVVPEDALQLAPAKIVLNEAYRNNSVLTTSFMILDTDLCMEEISGVATFMATRGCAANRKQDGMPGVPAPTGAEKEGKAATSQPCLSQVIGRITRGLAVALLQQHKIMLLSQVEG